MVNFFNGAILNRRKAASQLFYFKNLVGRSSVLKEKFGSLCVFGHTMNSFLFYFKKPCWKSQLFFEGRDWVFIHVFV
jgi:hypothetical protein